MEKSEFNIQFGKFVAEKRRSMNWPQVELASRMNNNFQNISRLERGEISPTFYWIFQLSSVFEIKCSKFIEEFESKLEKTK